MSLIHEFKAQVQTQTITLRWSFIKILRRHAITGQYEVKGQEPVRIKPWTTSNPNLPIFRKVLRLLLGKVERQQKRRGRSIQDVLTLIKLSDDINAQLEGAHLSK